MFNWESFTNGSIWALEPNFGEEFLIVFLDFGERSLEERFEVLLEISRSHNHLWLNVLKRLLLNTWDLAT